jgi:hypothetical protein
VEGGHGIDDAIDLSAQTMRSCDSVQVRDTETGMTVRILDR